MQKKYRYVIGLMSGTSLDGVDLVYVRFQENNYTDFKILCSETYDYPTEWKKKLGEAISYGEKEIQKLDIDYGVFLANKIILAF